MVTLKPKAYVLVDVHYDETKHRNTFDKVGALYSHIVRKIVEEFVPTCNTNKCQITCAPLQPIISSGFWQRMQIDLVDMKSVPDDVFTKIIVSTTSVSFMHYQGLKCQFQINPENQGLLMKNCMKIKKSRVQKIQNSG